uniref:Uncharacterized protein n=1 Tax=Anguilla anguilla TaxID=7936 RepID=A0A0E9WSJ8_ANGAN
MFKTLFNFGKTPSFLSSTWGFQICRVVLSHSKPAVQLLISRPVWYSCH